MPVYFNGTSVTNPYFNGTRLDYIYFNGTLVYQRIPDVLVVFSATHSGGSNTSITGYSNSVNNTNYVTVNPATWGKECGTAYGNGTVTVKNASGFSRVVIQYDIRNWASYGYSGDVLIDGAMVNNNDYTKWVSYSTEKSISNGSASMSWSTEVSAYDSEWEDLGISAGVHIVITKVTLYKT